MKGTGDDEERMTLTRVRDLLLIAVVAGLALWILIRYNYGAFPSLPWPAGVSLYVLAVFEFITGFIVRARVAGRDIGRARGQLHPIAVARVMVLAKASAILGAIAAGGWTGVLRSCSTTACSTLRAPTVRLRLSGPSAVSCSRPPQCGWNTAAAHPTIPTPNRTPPTPLPPDSVASMGRRTANEGDGDDFPRSGTSVRVYGPVSWRA